MAFVVDGAEWRFDGIPAVEVAAAIDSLLERVWIAKDRGEVVWIGDDLQTRHVLGDFDLWSLSSGKTAVQLTPEVWQELAAWLGSARRYVDETDWPEGFPDASTISIGEELAEENTDVAWAHHSVRARRAIACLGLRRIGQHSTVSTSGTAVVHWVTNEQGHRAFWLDAIDVEGDSTETLQRIAPHAFPDLYFDDGVWRGLNDFEGGYAAVRKTLRNVLFVLDTDGAWAFTAPPPPLTRREPPGPDLDARPSNQVIERRFRGFNLDMAPEKPDVFRDRTCRLAREIALGDATLYCEWHAKLEPHQNRVYVHAPVQASGGRVVIGIFHRHLPLPGER